MSPRRWQATARTPWDVLWHVSLYEVMTSEDQRRKQGKPIPEHWWWRSASVKSPTKTSKEWQGEPIPHSIIHCLLGYIYTLSKHHVFSQASTLAKHHIAFFLQKNTMCLFISKQGKRKGVLSITREGPIAEMKKYTFTDILEVGWMATWSLHQYIVQPLQYKETPDA